MSYILIDLLVSSFSFSQFFSALTEDGPLGAGWSHADYSEEVRSLEESGQDTSAFVPLLLEAFLSSEGEDSISLENPTLSVYRGSENPKNTQIRKKLTRCGEHFR